MFLPSTRLLWLLVALMGMGLAASIWSDYQPQWVALAGALLVFAGLDLATALRVPVPAVARRVASSLAVGVASDVARRVQNRSRMRVRMELHDHYPASFE